MTLPPPTWNRRRRLQGTACAGLPQLPERRCTGMPRRRLHRLACAVACTDLTIRHRLHGFAAPCTASTVPPPTWNSTVPPAKGTACAGLPQLPERRRCNRRHHSLHGKVCTGLPQMFPCLQNYLAVSVSRSKLLIAFFGHA